MMLLVPCSSKIWANLIFQHKDSPEERIQQNPEYQFSVALEQGLSLIALTDAGSSNDLQEISNLESQLAKLRYNFKQGNCFIHFTGLL